MTRAIQSTLRVLVIAFILSMAVPALAGHDVTRTVEFLGFSTDGRHYLLLIRDGNVGDFLSVRAFRTGKQVKSYPADEPAERKALTDRVRKRHRITDPGKESMSSPDGRFTLVGFPKGSRFHLHVMRGEKSARFHTIQSDRGDAGSLKTRLKTVFWSKDGRRIVVIIHRRLATENGMDADKALPFRFLGSSLNFR
ncbi:MAG: hypothetical protein ISR64_06780 [Deltaproteobacteria bacterium]|nr:hypothetical protein [Deltaproteobacteria bacterium]